MTTYADKETRKTWRINYGILKLDHARDAADYWERRGGAPSGCVLALTHAIEQIDADEAMLRQALDALEIVVVDVKTTPTAYEAHRQAIAALRERLKLGGCPWNGQLTQCS